MNMKQATRNDRLATMARTLPSRRASTLKQVADTVNSSHPPTVKYHVDRGLSSMAVRGEQAWAGSVA